MKYSKYTRVGARAENTFKLCYKLHPNYTHKFIPTPIITKFCMASLNMLRLLHKKSANQYRSLMCYACPGVVMSVQV